MDVIPTSDVAPDAAPETPARTCPLRAFKANVYRWAANFSLNLRRAPLIAVACVLAAAVVGATHWLGFTCPYFGATILGGYCCWAALR